MALGLAATALPTLASERVDQTLDLPADSLVEVISDRGDIRVTSWDEPRIKVSGELDDLTEEFIFEVRGNTARVQVVIPRRNANWGDGSELEITVPTASRLSVKAVSADIDARGVAGGVKLRTQSGDIQGRDLGGSYNARSASGDIEIENSAGKGNLSTLSGDIIVEADSPSLRIDTLSGEVEARLTGTSSLVVGAISGDVEIKTALLDRGEIEISSVSGDVELELLKPVNARLDITTDASGDITNRLTDDPVDEDQFPGSFLSATAGSGEGEISIRTVSGDIRLDSVE